MTCGELDLHGISQLNFQKKRVSKCLFRQHGCVHGQSAEARQKGRTNRHDEAPEVESNETESARETHARIGAALEMVLTIGYEIRVAILIAGVAAAAVAIECERQDERGDGNARNRVGNVNAGEQRCHGNEQVQNGQRMEKGRRAAI